MFRLNSESNDNFPILSWITPFLRISSLSGEEDETLCRFEDRISSSVPPTLAVALAVTLPVLDSS